MKHFIVNGFLPEFLPPRLKQGFVQEHSHLTFKKIKHCKQKSSSFILKKGGCRNRSITIWFLGNEAPKHFGENYP